MSGTEPESLSLGDCLLHLTHHGMTQECWSVVVEHYFHVVDGRMDGPDDPADLQAEAVNRYKATYERALLNAIRYEVADA